MELDMIQKVSVRLEGPINISTENYIYVEHLNKKFSIDVPNHITKEDRLRLKGLGKQSPDGRKGDLFLEFDEINNVGVYDDKHLFCIKCGQQLPEGSNFCLKCGWAITKSNEEVTKQRQTVYEGDIRKCPSCGEILDSFTANCPTCGFELRNTGTSDSVKAFFVKIEQAVSSEDKVTLIRSFPVSNTKEDVLEFIIFAATNVKGESDKRVFNAWAVKVEQCYQKAKWLFNDDAVGFERITSIYKQTKKIVYREKLLLGFKRVVRTSVQFFSRMRNPIFGIVFTIVIIANIIAMVTGNFETDGTSIFFSIIILFITYIITSTIGEISNKK